ncbi:hypothetical protein V6N11_003350 [Hibiscus sabdariffa]|uniref:Thaumatin-like protein 1b n=1 Tax=Hibiscus sabdariffa TaxID=183260 RepID=A0ABR2SDE7_9ROSI
MDLIFSTCFLCLISFFQGISGTTFTIVNKCDHTVWPGILGNSDIGSTGFELPSRGSRSFQAQPGWSGRFWGRSGCTSDQNTGQLTCQTADCGSSQVECNGRAATPPATLAEFTIGSGTQDFYDVSLVDGYNLPMTVEASGGSGACLSTGGAYATPDTCKPSVYAGMFKAACPKSYSYAYDDATSTFTCTGADYTITFCPSSTSQKSASSTAPPTTTGTTTNTTYGSIIGSSGQVPTYENSPWLPDFLTGESSRTLSSDVFHTTLLASAVSFICLFRFYS